MAYPPTYSLFPYQCVDDALDDCDDPDADDPDADDPDADDPDADEPLCEELLLVDPLAAPAAAGSFFSFVSFFFFAGPRSAEARESVR
jgi:hypothetical protein